ncbi:MAG: MFS transporter [Verrucomicrobia bacterium]|nr:MFS transporter [Verrucomicrobiota bacterium]
MKAGPRPGTGGWAAFADRNFALFWSARFLGGLGWQMQTVAMGWLVYSLSHRPFALGIIGLMGFLPSVALALVTGHLADVIDRRKILLASYGVMTGCALALISFTALGIAIIWPLYVLALLIGSARAFANPASQALLANLVQPGRLGNAIALSSSAWQLASVAGPALGGLLYAFGGTMVFGAVAALFLVCLLLLVFLRTPRQQVPRSQTTWKTLVAGIHYIWARPVIFGAISLDLFAVLFGGATALLPIYARDLYHAGPWGLGLLRSMPALGALLMAGIIAHRPLGRRTGLRMFQAVAVFGLATIGFGLSPSLAFALPFLFVLGASDMVSVVIRQTLVQADTPDAMRGRVAAVNSVFIGASNELGEFESGTVAALIGTVPSVVAGGLGTLLVVGLWMLWFPELRRRDRLVETAEARA